MPVIRDVMPAFELFQPTSIADTVGLLDRHEGAWLMAGGLDSFDWIKDRIKRPSVVIDLGAVAELRGIKEANGGLEIGANTSLTEITRHPVVAREVQAPRRSGRARRVAADPQPGIDRRQREPGCPLPLLPRRLAVLPRRRQHLLRGHADGRESRACDPRSGSLRRGHAVGHGAGADRTRCRDGRPQQRRRNRLSGPRLLHRPVARHHADDDAAAGRSAGVDPHSRNVRRQDPLLREGARPPGVGLRARQRRLQPLAQRLHHRRLAHRRRRRVRAAAASRGCRDRRSEGKRGTKRRPRWRPISPRAAPPCCGTTPTRCR